MLVRSIRADISSPGAYAGWPDVPATGSRNGNDARSRHADQGSPCVHRSGLAKSVPSRLSPIRSLELAAPAHESKTAHPTTHPHSRGEPRRTSSQRTLRATFSGATLGYAAARGLLRPGRARRAYARDKIIVLCQAPVQNGPPVVRPEHSRGVLRLR
jgi:hypothetical protein